jgi:hypothetical protein
MAQLFSLTVYEINGIPIAAGKTETFAPAAIQVMPYVGANAALNSTIVTLANGYAYGVTQIQSAIVTLAG